MSDDDVITIGEAFPRIEDVSALDQFNVLVKWQGGAQVVVNLGPNIYAMKHYAPLRSDRELFETVHVANASTIAWGANEAIDMHVSEVERLAGERMEATSFKEWLEELNLTRDSAAALLGMSRRMIGYYAGGREIPRYVALACAQIRSQQAMPKTYVVEPQGVPNLGITKVREWIIGKPGPHTSEVGGYTYIQPADIAAAAAAGGRVMMRPTRAKTKVPGANK